MRKLILFLSIFYGFLGLKAQDKMSFKKVDSLSYAYYLEGKWNELAEFGEKAIKEGYEYYYLFLRTGIANFKVGNYYSAEKYLKKGMASNPNDQLIKEYLYWVYVWRKDYWRADAIYADLDEETKGWVIHLEKDPLSFWHVGAGAFVSDFSDSAGTKPYFEIGAYHKFSTNFGLYHCYSYISQDLFDGGYSQHQYSIAPNYKLSKNIRLTSAVSLVYNSYKYDLISSLNDFSSTMDGPNTTEVETSGDASYNGGINSFLSYFELGAYIGFGRFNVNPSAGVFLENINSDYSIVNQGNRKTTLLNGGAPIVSNEPINGTESINNSANNTSYQLSSDFNYTPKLCSDNLSIGVDFILPISKNETNLLLSPTLSYNITEKVSFVINYLNKENYFVSEGSGTIINNVSFINSKRIKLTTLIQLKNSWTTYVVLQNEQIEDNLREIKYNSNNIILGLKF